MHYLDRYLGIPAVATLGLLRRKRALPDEIKSIGLLRLVAIGDTVLISAVAADLRDAFPQASIVFFAGPTNYELVQMLDSVDRVVKVPVHDIPAGIKMIRSVPVDIMIDFGPWPRLEALLTFASRASFTIGFETVGQYRHFAQDTSVKHSSTVHELENFRALITPLGVRAEKSPFIKAPKGPPLSSSGWAVCHLWPGGRRRLEKQWPTERWIRLIEEITSWGLDVVLTGGPADYPSNEGVIGRLEYGVHQRVRNKAGVTLKETAAILAGSSLTVSVDTGVMHLAAALGAPLVALYGPSSSRRWGALGRDVICIDSPQAGCGYISLGWERSRMDLACMECISFETVRNACGEVLKRGKEHVLVCKT